MVQYDLLAGAVSFILVFRFYLKRHRDKSITRLPLPPGPRGLPLIGNLLDMPKSFEWMTYHKWCKEFDSDIIHLNVVGTSMVVLDTSEAANELLERRSLIYSDRARMPMAGELMGWDFSLVLMGYGDRWRQHRKMIHQAFHPAVAIRFRPLELKAVHVFLRRTLQEPDKLLGHVRHLVSGTLISIAYGLDVLPNDDPYIDTAEEGNRAFLEAVMPGAFLVDTFPWLKYVPDWMPFTGFKRKAKEWRKLTLAVVEKPFEAGKQKIESGDATSSFISYSLENVNKNYDLAYQEEVIKGTAAAMYAAGSDTTGSALVFCILGLVTHPVVLKKAQAEIDAVVGLDQLPDFGHFDSLPYITAITKEALRWKEVAPIAVPHVLTVDDVYKGYRLPAGTVVVPNCWAMLHNETVYPDPFEFDPDRFMKDGQLNPAVRDPDAAFGFGRRICPGRYMAFSTLWVAIASLVAAFDINKAVDKNGEVIEPSQETSSTLVAIPLPFQCSVKPRSAQAEALIYGTANLEY